LKPIRNYQVFILKFVKGIFNVGLSHSIKGVGDKDYKKNSQDDQAQDGKNHGMLQAAFPVQ